MTDIIDIPRCEEVFAPWPSAQRVAERLARTRPTHTPQALRGPARLTPARAAAIAAWFCAPAPAAPRAAVRAAYAALADDTARIARALRDDLGVAVRHTHSASDPYDNAAQLCADLRASATMMLRTSACDPPHPLLDSAEGGTLDQLRAVHDVLGHAALGLGFDLQSEYATWLQCRALFSPAARPAAFTELVGAVTAYVVGGAKPPLRAALPPRALTRGEG